MPGELVSETLDHDGGRHVTVYVSPRPPEAVVFSEREVSHGDALWRAEFR